MNDAQQPYVTDENNIDELPFSPAQAQEPLPDLVSNKIATETHNTTQEAKQRFFKCVSLLSLNNQRQKIMVFGGMSVTFLIVFFLGWRLIAPLFSGARSAEVFQPAWLDHETTQQTPQSEQAEILALEPNASPQLAESTDSISRHKPEVESLINELVQINARVDKLEKKVNEFIAGPQIANVSESKTLTERPIAPLPQVRQTGSIPRIHQRHRPTRLNQAKRTVAIHNVATAKQDRQVSPKVQSTAQPGLQLKAVLEGRAWLQTKGGESITVSPGETVPGLGVAKIIDAEQGQIIFSNGLVLR